MPAKDKRRVLGPHLDPAAFVLHRGWIGPVVRLRQTDPEDPTPYWVFSTRHPDRLVEALRARATEPGSAGQAQSRQMYWPLLSSASRLR